MMQEYWITEYGAVADGVTNCAAAIQAAVDAAAQAGGGRVMVPAGRFLRGSVMLRSRAAASLTGRGAGYFLTATRTTGSGNVPRPRRRSARG